MKGNIKKLALVVIIAVIPMLIAVATASAAGKTIQGTYAVTGGHGALTAIGGFTDHTHFVPSNSSLWLMTFGTLIGVYTFNHDGTGEFTAEGWGIDVPGPGLNAPPDASSIQMSCKFTYTLDQGEITFTYVPGTLTQVAQYGPNAGQTSSYATLSGPWYGQISSDKKTLTVWMGVPTWIQPTADQANTQPLPVETAFTWTLQGYKTGN